MRLNTNVFSMNVYQNYKKSMSMQSKALEKVSTGNKINSAKDNPNGIGKSETLRMQIRGLEAAQRSVQDSASMMQSIDSSLGTINDSLIRIKELTIQASNDALADNDKKTIQMEIDQLKANIDTTAKNAEFNGVNLINNENVYNNNYPKFIKTTVGMNVGESMDIPVFNLSSSVLGNGSIGTVDELDVTTEKGASDALQVIDLAIKQVNSCRSKYGAVQNRLENTYDSMSVNIERTTDAYSSIKDADIAEEILKHANATILLDSATALLVQTNKLPSDALSMLKR